MNLGYAQRKAQEEAEMIKIEEKEKLMAEAAFKELDKNSDGILSYQEVQQFIKFDQNNDGVVDPDEAKFFLHMKEEMNAPLPEYDAETLVIIEKTKQAKLFLFIRLVYKMRSYLQESKIVSQMIMIMMMNMRIECNKKQNVKEKIILWIECADSQFKSEFS
uniref:EF-hand domain-containing protein n=1 Tax=Tetranychus urticae TaxID=32264 RepID=T1K6W2_TETUR